MSITIKTWAELYKETFENAYDLDPLDDLGLNEAERKEMLTTAQASLENHADSYLSQFGAVILGDGEIIANEPVEIDWEAFKDHMALWDAEKIIAPYIK